LLSNRINTGAPLEKWDNAQNEEYHFGTPKLATILSEFGYMLESLDEFLIGSYFGDKIMIQKHFIDKLISEIFVN